MNNAFDNIVPDKEINACGLMCPLPILRTRKALADMSSGQILRVRATDAGTRDDFSSFAAQTGNTLVACGEEPDGVFWFLLKRK